MAFDRKEYHREYMRKYRASHPEVVQQERDRMRDKRASDPVLAQAIRRKDYEANKEKVDQQTREWRLLHPEKVDEYSRAWRIRNPNKVKAAELRRYQGDPAGEKERVRVYRSQHAEQVREYAKQYRKDHPEMSREHCRRRRARKHNAPGEHTLEQWVARVEYYGWRCAYCGAELTLRTITQDHLIPLSRGGSDWAANLVPACQSCNSRKRDKTWSEFTSKAYIQYQ